MQHAELRKHLLRVLSYDPATGIFRWKVRVNLHTVIGTEAGTISADGRRWISIKRKMMLASRLAWLMAYGSLPKIIDHKNRNTLDNRLSNLRPATASGNSQNRGMGKNNTSGIKGVCWHKTTSKWLAFIRTNGKQRHLGLFDTKEQAGAAYAQAAKNLHGEFASYGHH